jgi:hypothetical protein
VALIEKHYQLQTIVKEPECSSHIETGRYLPLIADCRILVPREPSKPDSTVHAPPQ